MRSEIPCGDLAYIYKFVFREAFFNTCAVVNLILNLGQISSCATDAAGAFVGVIYGFVWGFFVAPFAADGFTSVCIIVKYGKKAFPFAIDENDNIIFIHEYAVNKEELPVLLETLRGEMQEAGLPDGLSNKAELVLEETAMIAAEKNKGKKQILGDCTLIIGKDTVNLITRDNGELYRQLSRRRLSGHHFL